MRRNISILIAAFVIAVFGVAMTGPAAEAMLAERDDMYSTGGIGVYVYIDGVQGDSTDVNHQDWIEAKNVSHRTGLKPTETTTTSDAFSTTTSAPYPLVITKKLDRASPVLHLLYVNKQLIRGVTVDVVGSSSQGPVTIMKYTLTDVRVHSVKTTSLPSPLGGRYATFPAEEVTFTYGSIRWDYMQGGPEAGWNFRSNTGM